MRVERFDGLAEIVLCEIAHFSEQCAPYGLDGFGVLNVRLKVSPHLRQVIDATRAVGRAIGLRDRAYLLVHDGSRRGVAGDVRTGLQ